jgi:hypothetical protein
VLTDTGHTRARQLTRIDLQWRKHARGGFDAASQLPLLVEYDSLEGMLADGWSVD